MWYKSRILIEIITHLAERATFSHWHFRTKYSSLMELKILSQILPLLKCGSNPKSCCCKMKLVLYVYVKKSINNLVAWTMLEVYDWMTSVTILMSQEKA